jgi:hypothetical protein
LEIKGDTTLGLFHKLDILNPGSEEQGYQERIGPWQVDTKYHLEMLVNEGRSRAVDKVGEKLPEGKHLLRTILYVFSLPGR